MGKFYDVMVDIETTGTQPDNAAMIQLAAIKFNLQERTVDSNNMFNRCLFVPPRRFWDESTREWWSKQKRDVILDIYARMEDPAVVLEDFAKWVASDNEEPMRFWGKPTHFDYAFVQSYLNEFGIANPFHYRYATDLNSFIRGLSGASNTEPFKVDFQGDAHNALIDVVNQINLLFKAVEHYRP